MALAFSRILLAYDDSAMSQLALAYAIALTRGGSILKLAHAVNESSIVATATTANGFAAIDPTPLIEEIERHGAHVLKTAIDACAARGITAQQVVLRDSAPSGILELAHADQTDLIVVGTHGRGGISRTLTGSVAESIVRASHVPVLIVNGHAEAPRDHAVFARALVALDDSDPSEAALAVARRIVADFGTHLTLCNVVDSRSLNVEAPAYGYDAAAMERTEHTTAMQFLERVASGTTVPLGDLVVVDGDPAPTIEHTAMQRNCDLIIMGSHARSGLGRIISGSVAEAVARSSSVPVLVVPMKR